METTRPWLRSFLAVVIATAAILTSTPLAPTIAVAGPRARAATACTSTPFRSAPHQKTWYRIPAIVNTGSALVAFAERRDNTSARDRGNYDVVARTSTTGGCSWGRLVVVADVGRNHISSPVPVWDPNAKTLLLFTSERSTTDHYVGLFVQRSTDNGVTWTAHGDGRVPRPKSGWKGGLQGPGHGLALTHGPAAGRLIFPLGYRAAGRYGTYGLYSDDHGRTWQVGYDRLAPGKTQLIEGTIAELPDGRLLVSYRDKRKTKPGTNRFSALVSADGTAFLTPYRTMPGVRTMAVQGSLLQTSDPATLLFSGPRFTASGDLTIRRDMSIFVSTDGGRHWRRGPLIGATGAPAAYSDLVEIDHTTVGILYETGRRSWREQISFTQVPRASLR